MATATTKLITRLSVQEISKISGKPVGGIFHLTEMVDMPTDVWHSFKTKNTPTNSEKSSKHKTATPNQNPTKPASTGYDFPPMLCIIHKGDY